MIRRQSAGPDLNTQFLCDLTSLSFEEAEKHLWPNALFGPTVARPGNGGWWLLNKPEKGWASQGRFYRTLRDIAVNMRVAFTEVGRDDLGTFVRIEP